MNTERTLKLKAAVMTACLHLGLVACVVLFGFAVPQEPEPQIVDAALVEMAKLGEILPDPKKLVRIEASASPPPEVDKAVSLSRRTKKQKTTKPKPKKKLKKPPKKKPKKKKAKTKKRAPRKKLTDLTSLIADEIDDERADDEDRRIGFKSGHMRGRSHDANALKKTYAFELSAALRSRLKVPEVIDRRARAGLTTKVFFKLSKTGKVLGKPRIVQSSGSTLFDHAALAAVNYFTEGRPGKLPLPKDGVYRKQIMKQGITTNMRPLK